MTIQFVEALRGLHDAGLEFIVVGGVSAVLHGASEPTRDLDVCIRPTKEGWARVHSFLQNLHPRFALTPDRRPLVASAEELSSFKNLYVLTDLGRIDFLGEVPPLGSFDSLNTTVVDLGGFRVRVLALDDLLRVKEFVRRPKDLEVAAELRAIRERTIPSQETDPRWWTLLGDAFPDVPRLEEALRALGRDELIAFALFVQEARWSIREPWSGPVIPGIGALSEDSTEDLTDWIVLQGREYWARVVAGNDERLAGCFADYQAARSPDHSRAWRPSSRPSLMSLTRAIWAERFDPDELWDALERSS